ncbi:hypothetical protein G443_002385 [Actinoalloteichus cyanogriseus DSM 43889]|uniref:Uncharacterized protein n=1 Tax=Actinoalloteichus caeruleus DSM 43889 TaxID=1120930 RepID=A0ABT1JHX1_ACTCY|nr:hypothetical protein [Actinoalloteichus caeruleus DSM 43889]
MARRPVGNIPLSSGYSPVQGKISRLVGAVARPLFRVHARWKTAGVTGAKLMWRDRPVDLLLVASAVCRGTRPTG